MPRLFVAIDLPETIKERLHAMCCGVPGARWLPVEQLHLTLRFIGEIDGGRLQGIADALGQVESEAFALQLKGIGFFPPRKNPRVLWVGVVRNERLTALYRRIESTLVRAGLEPEGRKFSPHITLARLQDAPVQRVGRFLEEYGLYASESFTVDRFQLYSSVLSQKGAKHYLEEVYPLGVDRTGGGMA